MDAKPFSTLVFFPLLVLLAAPVRATEDEAATATLIAELGLRESATAVSARQGWAPPRKIVVPASDAARLAWMQQAAPGVVLLPAKDREEAAALAADADAVIGYCTPEVVAAGTRVRWIQVVGAGVERCVGIPGFAERGISTTIRRAPAASRRRL